MAKAAEGQFIHQNPEAPYWGGDEALLRTSAETDACELAIRALDALCKSNIRASFAKGHAPSIEKRRQAEKNRRDFSEELRSALAGIAMSSPEMELIPEQQRQTVLDFITGSFAQAYGGPAASERRAEVRKNPAAGVDFVMRALKVFVTDNKPGAIKSFRR